MNLSLAALTTNIRATGMNLECAGNATELVNFVLMSGVTATNADPTTSNNKSQTKLASALWDGSTLAQDVVN